MDFTLIRRILYTCFVILFFSLQLTGQTFGKRFLNETENQTEPMLVEELQQRQVEQQFILEKPIDPAQYILGPGDKLGITIVADKTINFDVIIAPTEELLIPGIGIVELKGLTLLEARKKIDAYIKENAFQNAKVAVGLKNIRTFKVQISGAIYSPGFYKVTPVSRLDELIDQADGVHQLAREFNISIVHKNNLISNINYLRYRRTGDLEQNPQLIEGDHIIVPFANIKKEGLVIRGSITGSGYDIIEKNEPLESFMRRRAEFNENADLESVKIIRSNGDVEQYITVFPEDFATTILQPGDQIDILSERGVSVIGFVQAPGGYRYFPGYSASDYISLAGGNTVEGDAGRAVLNHLDGKNEKASNGVVRRGDVIVVPRTRHNVLFGGSSILQIVVSVFSILLTFIAATK